MELKGRTAIITGAGTGIGRAIALEFARCGAKVVCCGRRGDKLSEVSRAVARAGGQALAIPADVTQPADVHKLVEGTLRRFGAIDVLYNNAASFHAFGGIWETDAEQWWRDVTVNLRGPMLCCQAVLPHMLKRNSGIIINMNGGGGVWPLAGGSGYGCSKAALLRLTDTLAAELSRIGSAVLVFSLGPGLVRTETTALQTADPLALKWMGSTAEAFARGQTRPPEDCARAAVKLLAIACPELSGRVFEVDTDFEDVARQAKTIKQVDDYVLRLRRTKAPE